MCGIGGIARLDGEPVSEGSLRAMNRAQMHRGPDHQDIWMDGNIGLAHTRLSIIDLSERGNQPMHSACERFVIVHNGEIYNYVELRRQLEGEGVRFRSESDTEVLVNLFARRGREALSLLRGMFAFAVWDTRESKLFLARDRMGIKPLYYVWDGRTFAFASEIKALIAAGFVRKEMSREGLANFFHFGHAIGDRTVFTGVKKLLPGHCILVSESGLSVDRYWTPPTPEVHPFHSWNETEEAVTNVLRESVRDHMVADVPVGVLLSGGIDSTSILSFMAEYSARPVKTFSLGYPGHPKSDELALASAVAEHFGAEHTEIRAGPDSVLETLEKVVEIYDEPFADASGVNVFLISKEIAKQVKVVLSGDGGDELFGGYRRYVAEKYSRFYRAVPAVARKLLRLVVWGRKRRLSGFGKLAWVFENDADYQRWGTWLDAFPGDSLATVLLRDAADGVVGARSYDWMREWTERARDASPVSRMCFADQNTWLPDTYLEKVDKATMAASIEARVPFLDDRVVEVASRIPGRYKVRGTKTKYVLKRAMRSRLPRQVLRHPKTGFSMPLSAWLASSEMDGLKELLLDRQTQAHGFFARQGLERLFEEHERGAEDHSARIWFLAVFELWMRKVYDVMPEQVGTP